MDFVYFVSHTNNNDLFKDIIQFFIEEEIYIHLHNSGEYSILSTVLGISFNKENKLAFMKYIESYPTERTCYACSKF